MKKKKGCGTFLIYFALFGLPATIIGRVIGASKAGVNLQISSYDVFILITSLGFIALIGFLINFLEAIEIRSMKKKREHDQRKNQSNDTVPNKEIKNSNITSKNPPQK